MLKLSHTSFKGGYSRVSLLNGEFLAYRDYKGKEYMFYILLKRAQNEVSRESEYDIIVTPPYHFGGMLALEMGVPFALVDKRIEALVREGLREMVQRGADIDAVERDHARRIARLERNLTISGVLC